MGIRFSCPNGHPLNVKDHLAGKRGICPSCGAKFVIPAATEAPPVPQPAGASVSSVPVIGAASQSENPSVVIKVAEEAPIAPVSRSPAPQIEASTPPVVQAIPKVDAAAPATPQPVVVAHSEQPTSPASKYVAHRERVRRNRTRVAILLLVAVILLAGVLIWMLVNGPVGPGAAEVSSACRPSQPLIQLAWCIPTFHFEFPMWDER
jgi:hypothetical protein